MRRACAALRWLESAYVLRKPAAPARRPSSTVPGRTPTCQLRPPASSRRSRVRTHKCATVCSLSGGGAARALAACARYARWLESVPASRRPTAPARRPSSSVHGRALTCQMWPPTAFEFAHTRTRHRVLSLGKRRSTCACGLRALRRADWRWLPLHGSSLRQRDGPLPRCTAVL